MNNLSADLQRLVRQGLINNNQAMRMMPTNDTESKVPTSSCKCGCDDVDEKLDQDFECEICLCPIERPSQRKTVPGCNHTFCRECLIENIEHTFASGTSISHIGCPACKKPIDDGFLRTILSKQQFRIYNTKLRRNRIRKYKNFARRCSYPIAVICAIYALGQGYLNVETLETLGQPDLEQDGYTKYLIGGCVGMAVAQITWCAYDIYEIILDTLSSGLSSFVKWAATKRCPHCRAPIQKNMGCNHMTCVCGHEFCWHCSAPWRLRMCPTYGHCPYAALFYAAPALYLVRAVVRYVHPLRITWDFVCWLLSYPLGLIFRVALVIFSMCRYIMSFPWKLVKKGFSFVFRCMRACATNTWVLVFAITLFIAITTYFIIQRRRVLMRNRLKEKLRQELQAKRRRRKQRSITRQLVQTQTNRRTTSRLHHRRVNMRRIASRRHR